MHPDKNVQKTQPHDVDEMNRDHQEKSPPGSFTGTNIDRYVTGERAALDEEDAKKVSNLLRKEEEQAQ